MQLYQLEQFQILAQYEHMTRAAEHLHISQPALSQSIHRLEEELGVPLFERQGRKITLSRYGSEFLRCVESIFLRIDDGKKLLNDMKQTENRRVRLADIGTTFVTGNILRLYSKVFPDIALEYLVYNEQTAKQALRSGEIDLVFTTAPFKDQEFSWTPMGVLGLELLVPDDYPYENDSDALLLDFSKSRFIGPSRTSESRAIFESYCFELNFVPRFSYESNDMSLMIELTANHRGILYVLNGKTHQFQECCLDQIKDANLKRLHIKNFTHALPFGIATLTEHYLSPTLVKFIEFTKALFTE